jgi:hypothetical protein
MKLAEAISISQETEQLYAEVAAELRGNLREHVLDYKREQAKASASGVTKQKGTA